MNLIPTVIEKSQIEDQWVRIRRGAFEYADNEDAIVGKKVRQFVSMGEGFSVRVLDSPMVVSRNQPVTMIIKSGDVEVTAKATTVDAGAMGQVVEVVNFATKKRMRAKVLSSQTVEAVAF